MSETKSQFPLIEIYGKNGFFKIKSALEMDDRNEQYGKMMFSFVNATDPTKFVDCYMDVHEFNCLMEDIYNGKIKELLAANKKYTSNYGGKKEGSIAYSRYFTISASTMTDYFFTAVKIPADITDKGAYKPKAGAKATVQIQVPAAHTEFRKMYPVWKTLYDKYLTRYITMERFKNNYERPTEQG